MNVMQIIEGLELGERDIEQMMAVSERVRTEFLAVGEHAVASGVSNRIIRPVLMAEALLFAAALHRGSARSFGEIAALASTCQDEGQTSKDPAQIH
jgi:hypothetical protein